MPVSHAPRRLITFATFLGALSWAGVILLRGQSPQGSTPFKDAWGPWLEADAPFFSSVLDARRAGATLPASNLSPRTIVLPAGEGRWLAFDPDLLRVAAGGTARA